MGLYLKITAGLLLLVQAFHLAALQQSTDSPGKPIDISWFREFKPKNTTASQNAAFPTDEGDYNQETDADAAESNNEFSSGIASGSMAVNTEEEQNVAGKTPDDLTAVTTDVPTATSNATISPNATTADPTNSSQVNMTGGEEEFHNWTMTPQNSTTHPSAQNSTSFPDNSTGTDLQTTTSAPEESTTKKEDKGFINATESTSTTTVTTTVKPEIQETSTTSSSTTVSSSETTETSPGTTTAAAPITPEKANKTDEEAASGSSSERGLATDTHKTKRNGAWGAVLGTGVAVAFVALVTYIILRKKHRKGFSHSKLEEEYPSDPVLRLDNSEPLDLNFGIGGSAYYNPGLQGDNIQMSSFPERHRN